MTQSPLLIAILLVALLGIVLGETSARAADGVIEINQAQALAGGVTATDTPGFPVTIDTPGSYALTSDLSVSGFDTTGVEVTSEDVTLDLRGFTIQGPCPPVACLRGRGIGVGVDAGLGAGNQVRNGRIRHFASDGVVIGPRSRASALIVERNGEDGILVFGGADIVDSKAIGNGSWGVLTGFGSRVHNCVADSNGEGGIFAFQYSILSDNSTSNNRAGDGSAGDGIAGDIASLIQNNIASANQRYGILVGSGSLVIENVANQNSNIGILFGSLVQGNELNQNGQFGVFFGSDPGGYRENVLNLNAGGTVVGGRNLGRNACNGVPCP